MALAGAEGVLVAVELLEVDKPFFEEVCCFSMTHSESSMRKFIKLFYIQNHRLKRALRALRLYLNASLHSPGWGSNCLVRDRS